MAQIHPKVKAATGVGGVGALVAWIVGQYGVPVPPEVAVAVNTIAAFAASYVASVPKPHVPVACQCSVTKAQAAPVSAPDSETHPIVHKG